jgi:hypothetical protein
MVDMRNGGGGEKKNMQKNEGENGVNEKNVCRSTKKKS